MDPSKHAPLRINDIRSKYKVIDKVGKGTYGTVFKVLNLQDNKYYAIKKFENTEAKLQVEGFPITALREISLLKQLNHPNIANLQEIICSKPNKRNLYRGSTFMVFQYMHHDFAGLLRSKIKFTLAQTKSIMRQLLLGCSFLHQNKVMHRDIKSANILLNDQGIVQLVDFGLGRRTRFDNVYTYKVVTLWYRAPELLLGCKTYNHKVDVWSIGCVFAELLTGDVLFKKQTEYAIIEKIYEICGDLQQNEYTEDYLRGCVYYNDMRPKKSYKNTLQSCIKKLCPNIDPLTIQFLQGLLELNPYKRLSCEEALEHEFFKAQPKACEPQQIQKLQVEYHEMFRDRSLKIERKVKNSSPNWSEEEERKKVKKEKSVSQERKVRDSKQYIKPDKDKGYTEKPYERRNYDNRYDERKHQNYRRQYSSSSKYQDDNRHKKKYTRSPSHSSSSSSSSSSSIRSRSRNGKRHYDDDKARSFSKKQSYNQRQKGDVVSVKKENGYPSDRSYSDLNRQKDRSYGDREKGYNRKGYEQRGETYKKQYYEEETRTYKQKSYASRDIQRERKEYPRPQYSSRKQSSYRPAEKYPKQDYDRSYPKVTSKQRYPQEEKSYKNLKYDGEYRGKYDDYKSRGDDYRPRHQNYHTSKDNYDLGYKGRRETDQRYGKEPDRYSKPYSRESKDEYAKKQYHPSSQKYPEDKPYVKPREKQYRDQRLPYDYSRKQSYSRDDSRFKEHSRYREDFKQHQSRYKEDSIFKDQSKNKDLLHKKISIQSRQSTEQKKSSPQKKPMDVQQYEY